MIPIPRRVGFINGVMSVNNNESAAPNNNNAAQHVVIDLNNLIPQPPSAGDQPPTARATSESQPMETSNASAATASSSNPQPAAAANTPAAQTAQATDAAAAAANNQVSVARLIQGIVNSVSLYSDFELDMNLGMFGGEGADIQAAVAAAAAAAAAPSGTVPAQDEQMPDAANNDAPSVDPAVSGGEGSAAAASQPTFAAADPAATANGNCIFDQSTDIIGL